MSDNPAPAYSTSTSPDAPTAPRRRSRTRPSQRSKKARVEPIDEATEARLLALPAHLARFVTAEETHLIPARIRQPHPSRQWTKLDLEARLSHVEAFAAEEARRTRRPARPRTLSPAIRARLNALGGLSAYVLDERAHTAPTGLRDGRTVAEWVALTLEERVEILEAVKAREEGTEPAPASVVAPETAPEAVKVPKAVPAPSEPQKLAEPVSRPAARLSFWTACARCGDAVETDSPRAAVRFCDACR